VTRVRGDEVPTGAVAVRLTRAETDILFDHLVIAAARAHVSGHEDRLTLDAVVRKIRSLGEVAGLTVHAVTRITE